MEKCVVRSKSGKARPLWSGPAAAARHAVVSELFRYGLRAWSIEEVEMRMADCVWPIRRL